MTDTYLNKTHKRFYFQTRISCPTPVPEHSRFWETNLHIIDDLHKNNDAHIYRLVWDGDVLKLVFSTPYFNENILMHEWELRLRAEFQISFERPILCEPISSWDECEESFSATQMSLDTAVVEFTGTKFTQKHAAHQVY